MTILLWNVRGHNKKGRKRDVQHHISSLSSSIVGLVETQIKLSKMSRIFGCVPARLSLKGRIWAAWNPAVWSSVVYAISIQQISVC